MKKLFIWSVFPVFASLLAFAAYAASLTNFVDLVEEQGKAVVNISTTQKSKSVIPGHGDLQMPEIPEDSPFHDFFEKFFGQMPQTPDQQPSVRSLGSGFIISEDGYVLTSAHVVDNADEIIVRMTDRREMLAKVIGTDKRSDVALLKVNSKGCHT